jgi:AcrR family transcriptional regulator
MRVLRPRHVYAVDIAVYAVDMAGETADRIVSATRAIVVQHGSAAVSMRRVAAAVGMTPMAIYRHFASRDALLAVVADQLFAELGTRWAGHAWSDDLEADIAVLLADHLDFALRQPRLYAFLFTEVRANARRYPDDFTGGGSPTLSVLAGLLTEGVRRRVFREHDVWEQALIIAAVLHGLVQLHHGGRLALEESAFRALCGRAIGSVLGGIRT